MIDNTYAMARHARLSIVKAEMLADMRARACFLAEARWVMHVREEMDAEQLQEARWIYQGTKGRRTWEVIA